MHSKRLRTPTRPPQTPEPVPRTPALPLRTPKPRWDIPKALWRTPTPHWHIPKPRWDIPTTLWDIPKLLAQTKKRPKTFENLPKPARRAENGPFPPKTLSWAFVLGIEPVREPLRLN